MSPSCAQVEALIRPASRVLDIGPGIRPLDRFATDWYLAVEPHGEYVDVLKRKGLMVLQMKAVDALPLIQGVDLIFLIDVLEHMERKEGEEVLRMAKEKAQVVAVFTPLGFSEQSYKPGEPDAWGMQGQFWQTHRSGWEPEDFAGWNVGITPNMHGPDKGAIYALYGR